MEQPIMFVLDITVTTEPGQGGLGGGGNSGQSSGSSSGGGHVRLATKKTVTDPLT